MKKKLLLFVGLLSLIVTASAQPIVPVKGKNKFFTDGLLDVLCNVGPSGFWETESHSQNWTFNSDSTFSAFIWNKYEERHNSFPGKFYIIDDTIYFYNVVVSLIGIPDIDYPASNLQEYINSQIPFSFKSRIKLTSNNDSLYIDSVLLVKPEIKSFKARFIDIISGEQPTWVFSLENGDTAHFSRPSDWNGLLDSYSIFPNELIGKTCELKTIKKIIPTDNMGSMSSKECIIRLIEY